MDRAAALQRTTVANSGRFRSGDRGTEHKRVLSTKLLDKLALWPEVTGRPGVNLTSFIDWRTSLP